ncbi:DNA excision repair protein ERCC-8 [Tetranychus urticae]|uniref:Anaphase-promoting complex subunit 4 WD40 domain-containing protein n=1 Tax=Tetranychus urticae TaxID=32264 RepID=T1KHS1_TETUR|nr:DNA excision repair protein ERCC-8 [Tetranychus urticae]
MEQELFSHPSLLAKSQIGAIDKRTFKEQFIRGAYSRLEYEPIFEVNVSATVNYIDVDPSVKFSLVSDCDGNISIYEIEEESCGRLRLIEKRQFVPLTLNKSQWFPADNGLLQATYPNKVVVVDTNTLKLLDAYDFGLKKVYNSDWNKLNPNLIAVGTSGSSIRFIDIRSGCCLQQITVESLLGASSHNVSRVCWSPVDDECLFAGDSSGFIHIFDIRKPRKSLQSIGSDNTTCEPVVNLSFTCDNMNLITAHGIQSVLNQWTFKNRTLVNSNINYPFPYCRVNKKKSAAAAISSAFLKCQLYVTESLLFKPICDGTFGGELCCYDLKNGERLRTLSPTTWNPDNCMNVHCVTGFHRDYPVLISGSRRFIRVWGLGGKKDDDQKANQYHEDDWG